MPTIRLYLRFCNGKNKPLMLQAIDCRCFTIFELDLLFTKARLRMVDAGMRLEIYEVQPNLMFKGYQNMVLKHQWNTGLNRSLAYAVQNISDHLTQQTRLCCSWQHGLSAFRMCHQILPMK